MLATSLNPSAERELAALHDTLQRYHTVSRRDIGETLARKAEDLRIQLYRGYWDQRYKGPRKGARQSEGVAFRHMRQRARAGDGIRLRHALQSGAPSPQAPVEYFQRRKLRGAHGTTRRLRVPITMSTYQRRVWTELARRQTGIGVLGVAFLMQRYRKRFSVSSGSYVATGATRLRDNKTAPSALQVQTQLGFGKNLLGRLILAPTFARLEGFVPGHAEVGARHSILEIALRDVRQDTELYLARKTVDSITAELEAAGFHAS